MSKLDLNKFGAHFINEEFELLYKTTSKDFQNLLGLNEFQNICHSYKQGIQKLEKFSEKEWFGTTQVIWIDQNKEKAIQLAYDPRQVITGFYLKPFITYDSDKRRTKNQYRMPIRDEWFVFWGGTNEFDNYHYAYENQRYAYDLVRVINGVTYEGTNLINENYFAFGKDIVAPLNGKVVEVVDGIKDNVPGKMNEQYPAGNYIVIEHSNKENSMIAHFKNGSILVKEGEHVKEGQLLGLCGNSGNSSEAHIHFQVMDRPQFEKAKSIRIQFQNHLEPVQGDTVTSWPLDDNKMDTFDKLENSLTFTDIVLTIPKIIGQYFKG
ncbi:M23 family metallopeptidase [Psychrobacillus sp. FSL K6-1267]|uniref:M23 family metallopeptidase n=1 Tax=Psychrobacillus sp. FSL K6-1267 TaxID=2921543 RepID=UPI0030F8664A